MDLCTSSLTNLSNLANLANLLNVFISCFHKSKQVRTSSNKFVYKGLIRQDIRPYKAIKAPYKVLKAPDYIKALGGQVGLKRRTHDARS